MEELVRRVSEQAGISEEQARSAVNTVAEFLKEKVPAPFTGYIDNFMGTGGGSGTAGGISAD
jgi:nucleoid DNA-binding protein